MDKRLERILPRVQKPARYTGGEYQQIIKDKRDVTLRMALCFPDIYEIGMSNLGTRILYGALNQLEGVWCERAYAPWSDMDEQMRQAGVPLYALESGDPLTEFDALGFSVGYEMAYTGVLNMLSLAGIPLRSAERTELLPLVFAGGTSCCNPEPMAEFFDLFAVGEGEELDAEILLLLQKAKAENWSKQQFLCEAAKIDGVYVPSLYTPVYAADGTLSEVVRAEGAPERVTKRIIRDFENSYFPEHPIVPSTEIVHDRVNLELFRGCIRGCRFCQAGWAYRPVRYRSAERAVGQGIRSVESTGYQEASLASLSTSDYPELPALCDGLLEWFEPRSVSLSLPSLRADNFSIELMEKVQRVRKSGLTFAPEAGSQRLRDAINKNVTEEALLNTCRIAFAGGWNTVKLYFMLGLPTETDEDVIAIAELTDHVLHCWRTHAKNKNRGVRITVSTSCFVPKPHTPFQWEPQISMEEYMRRVCLLRDNMRARNVTYNWHDPETSLIEAVLSRGDRRLGAVIEAVWRAGGNLEAWSEHFKLSRWMQAFEETGIDPAFYANRSRDCAELLPWDIINLGVDKRCLVREREAAYDSRLTPDCRAGCAGCGANALMGGGFVCE